MVEKYEITQYQKALKDLLREVAKILCDKGIPFFGVTGTCLGAVRHHDIIPWDDDVDIAVPRKDFSMALDALRNATPDLYVWNWDFDTQCDIPGARIFRKIRNDASRYENCAFIDLAPIDNAPASMFGRIVVTIFAIAIRRLVNRKSKTVLTYKKYTPSSMFFYCVALPFSVLPVGVLKQFYNWIVTRKRVSSISWFPTIGRRFTSPSECFANTDKAMFGDLVIPIPSQTDKYLRSIYGDNWREPLPEEERGGHTFGDDWSWKVTKPADELRMDTNI